ncbi:MAG TPA: hypothetical protein VFU73_14410 [Actinocrinis sp.]|nr:hypothetical protein [Actinocrinis sp.]
MNAESGRGAADERRAARLPGLLAAARRGDESAWAELIGQELRAKVYAATRRRIADPDVLDEAWQEAAVIAQRHVLEEPGQDGADRLAEGNFDGWFYRTFSRLAFKLDRTSAGRRARRDDLDEQKLAAPKTTEDAVLSEAHLRHLADRALRAMSPSDRLAFQIHLETDLLGGELAQEMSRRERRTVSADKAAVNLWRARNAVIDRLDAALLALRGPQCPELQEILGEHRHEVPLPDKVAKAAAAHRRKCPRCKEFMAKYPPTAAEQTRLLGKISEIMGIPPVPVLMPSGPAAPTGTVPAPPASPAAALGRQASGATRTAVRRKVLTVSGSVTLGLTVALPLLLPDHTQALPRPSTTAVPSTRAVGGGVGADGSVPPAPLPTGAVSADPSSGLSQGPGFTPSGGAPTSTASSGSAVAVSSGQRPASGDPVWGFAQDWWVSDPLGSTHELTATPEHPDNSEADYTYGIWRLGNPNPIPVPTAEHVAPGRQLVVLPGVAAPGGIVQVSVYDYPRSGASCQPVGWRPQDRDEAVDVACFDGTGKPADERFDLLFLAGTGTGAQSIGGPRGFVYASKPTAAAYTPGAPDESGAGEVIRSATGHYAVAVPSGAEALQVSPVGAKDASCAVTSPSGTTAFVSCTAHDGTPADTAFVLSYTGRQTLLDDSRRPHAAFLSVTDGPSAAAPVLMNWWLSKAGTPTVSRTSTGQYTLKVPLGMEPSYTHLTAYDAGYCTVVLRNDYSFKDNATFYIACFTPEGMLTNSGFELTYVSGSPFE